MYRDVFSSAIIMSGYISRSLFHSGKALYKSHVCRCKIINNGQGITKRSVSYSRQLYSNKKLTESEDLNKDEEPNLPSGLVGKYKVFRDEDAPVIFDVNEEKKRIELGELNIQEEDKDPYKGINLEHGVHGVFDIEDLVELLKKDNARQIFVATVPKEYSYVDYIVVASGKSTRHLHALATFVRKIYKIKRHKNDTIPKIEGESSKDWMAMDLGNIALHLLTHEARLKYDLETLWSVGSQYDDISNKKDQDLDLMDKYSAFLRDLQPAE